MWLHKLKEIFHSIFLSSTVLKKKALEKTKKKQTNIFILLFLAIPYFEKYKFLRCLFEKKDERKKIYKYSPG